MKPKDFGYVCSRRGYRSGFDGGKRGRIGQEIRKVLRHCESWQKRLPNLTLLAQVLRLLTTKRCVDLRTFRHLRQDCRQREDIGLTAAITSRL